MDMEEQDKPCDPVYELVLWRPDNIESAENLRL